MTYTEDQRARDESLMSPTQLLQREAFLGPAGLERLARMRRDGIVSEYGPIVASDNREDGKPVAKSTSLLASTYYLLHKSFALSVPYETSTPIPPQQKKFGNVVVDAQTNEPLYEDTGLSCSFTGAAAPPRNADGSYKISTPDVRQEKGSISFAQTAAMDTAAYYSVTALPPTIQVDFSRLPGGKAPLETSLITGPSFASQSAPIDVMALSTAFAPFGGMDAKPITFEQVVPLAQNDTIFDPKANKAASGAFKAKTTPTYTKALTSPAAPLQLIDAPGITSINDGMHFDLQA